MIYAIRCGSFGPIKIGRATNPIQRMSDLQTAHHEPLNLIAAVKWPDEYERRIHAGLAAQRLSGEWFKPEELVLWTVSMMQDRESSEALFERLVPVQSVRTEAKLQNTTGLTRGQRTANRRDRQKYNAYQREYMRKRRAKAA